MTIVQSTNPETRYVVDETDVLDVQIGRRAKFQNAGVAQIGADWLNSADGEPESYDWTTPCPYDWCEEDHTHGASVSGLHSKLFERAGIRFDFVLDEQPDAHTRTYINWTDCFEEEFAPTDLGRLNDIAAAIIVGKAAFEQFVEEVSK